MVRSCGMVCLCDSDGFVQPSGDCRFFGRVRRLGETITRRVGDFRVG
jgi:hypothetical protein